MISDLLLSIARRRKMTMADNTKYSFVERTRLGNNRCPHCNTELNVGFGLAGGGFGAYTYCPAESCGKYFDKTQEPREDDQS